MIICCGQGFVYYVKFTLTEPSASGESHFKTFHRLEPSSSWASLSQNSSWSSSHEVAHHNHLSSIFGWYCFLSDISRWEQPAYGVRLLIHWKYQPYSTYHMLILNFTMGSIQCIIDPNCILINITNHVGQIF